MAYLCIRRNDLHKNSALYGGGIHTHDSSNDISSNVISVNVATEGGGIMIKGQSIVSNNIITSNFAYWRGGGILSREGSPQIINNTLCLNKASGGGGVGTCIYSGALILNTILWNNEADAGKEIYIGDTSKPSFIDIRHSDVEGGQASIHVESGCTLNWGTGMIDADPHFADPVDGDFHIPFTSPCKDTGENATIPGAEDFEGDPRIANGITDMGADEFHPHLYHTGDAVPHGKVEIMIVGIPETYPVGLWIGSDVLDPPLPTIWGDWHLAFPCRGPILLRSIPAPGGIMVLPGSIPPNMTPPRLIPMQALVGDILTNLCVLEIE